MTKQQKIVAALEAEGWAQVRGVTRKYIQLAPPVGSDRRGFAFVGKAGAIRIGRTVATSLSASDSFKQCLLALHKENRQ